MHKYLFYGFVLCCNVAQYFVLLLLKGAPPTLSVLTLYNYLNAF